MSDDYKFWYFVGYALSTPENVLGLFLLFMVTAVLAWSQFSNRSQIDLAYILVDPKLKKVTLAKFGGFGAFVASTWVLVALTARGHFDAGYASVYLITWAGVKVASDFKHTKEGAT